RGARFPGVARGRSDRRGRRLPCRAAQGAGVRLPLEAVRADRGGRGGLRTGAQWHAEPHLHAARICGALPHGVRRRRGARLVAELTPWRVARLADKAPIRAFLNRDRALTAYAIGDLDDAFWPQSAYYGAARNGAIEALALVYRGLEPPVFCAFGAPDGVRAILRTPALDLPDEVYVLLPPDLA